MYRHASSACASTHLVHGGEPRLAAGGVLGIDGANASHVGGEHVLAVLERHLACVRLLELDLVVAKRVRLIVCVCAKTEADGV